MSFILDILLAIAVIFIVCVLITYLTVRLFFYRNLPPDYDYASISTSDMTDEIKDRHQRSIDGEKWFMSRDPEDVTITSYDGLTLKGRFLPAKEGSAKTVICVHGYRCYSGLYEFGSRLEFLYSLGLNLLVIDQRSHGRSDGRFIGMSIPETDDVKKWIGWVDEKTGPDSKIILYGISMGAATVLNAAGEANLSSSVKAVIEDCGFSSAIDEMAEKITAMAHLPKNPFIPMSKVIIKLTGKYDIDSKIPREQIKNFKGKLLVIHGDADTFVPTYMHNEIYDNATCEKKKLIVPKAEHIMSYYYATDEYQALVRELADEI
ncbi:MAG: alpha/beta hydrolase [Lachnospiraceae bacterium]|nr:alpha/beta hydrolase [Lachnospiraceae bacterium]